MGKYLILLGLLASRPASSQLPDPGESWMDIAVATVFADLGMLLGGAAGFVFGEEVDPTHPDVAFSAGGLLGALGGGIAGGTAAIHGYGRARGRDGHALAATGGVLLGLLGTGVLCGVDDSGELCFLAWAVLPGSLGAGFWFLSASPEEPHPGDPGPPFLHEPNVGLPRPFLRAGPTGDLSGGLTWQGAF